MDDDFQLFLQEIGLTQEDLDEALPKMPPPLPRDPSEKYYVADSAVQGLGVFASEDVDGFIGRMWDDGDWYEAGRYLNHSPSPNCRPIKVDGVVILIGEAKADEELFVNYRDVREILS